MGWAERVQRETAMPESDKAGSGDQHTVSARQMVQVMLAADQRLQAAVDRAKVDPRPVDFTPMIIGVLAAQARTLAFVLDELLVARGEPRAIVFTPPRGNGKGLEP